MSSLLKNFLSREYFTLVFYSKFPLFRSKRIRVGGYKFQYPDWNQFYGLCREIFIEKIYKTENVRDCRTIMDAGANIGLAAAYFNSAYPGAHIICFEPNPEAFEFLKENMQTNGINAALHPVALGKDNK